MRTNKGEDEDYTDGLNDISRMFVYLLAFGNKMPERINPVLRSGKPKPSIEGTKSLKNSCFTVPYIPLVTIRSISKTFTVESQHIIIALYQQ